MLDSTAVDVLTMIRDLYEFNPTTGEKEPWKYKEEIEALNIAIKNLKDKIKNKDS